MYSERVRELISTLPNRGTLAEATHRSRSENPVCGDITHLYLKIEGDLVQDCRFQTHGCPGAIAAAAAITLLCKGKTTTECRQLTIESLLDFLQGLPSHKIHGAELALAALKKALISV
ncbi:MAG: iron-sulfur cluster assembly scaffold protein [Acidobacteriota bacterium]